MVSTLKPLAILVLMLLPIPAFPQKSDCSAAGVGMQNKQQQNQNTIKIWKIDFTGYPNLLSAEQEEISAVLSKTTFQADNSQQEVGNELKTRVTQQWQQRGYFRVTVGAPEIR